MVLANTLNRYQFSLGRFTSLTFATILYSAINWSDLADVDIDDFDPSEWEVQIQVYWKCAQAGITGYLVAYDQFGDAEISGSELSQVFAAADTYYTTLSPAFSLSSGAKDIMVAGKASNAYTITITTLTLIFTRK